MTEFLRAQISDIHEGERLRPVDPEYVEALASSFDAHGQINPITVRSAPAQNKGATPLVLVAGSYRLAAAKLLGWAEIDAVKVSANKIEAQIIEIAENLYRNDLNPLDRALFVMKYRELWEEKNGKIEHGGDRKSKAHDAPLIFSPGRELSSRIQDQLGISKDVYKRAVQIGQKLHPALRAAIRGLPAERDQSRLLRLCKMPADEQAKIAAGLKELPDLDRVIELVKGPKPEVDPQLQQLQLLERLCGAWEKASEETREQFLETIGMSDRPDPVMKIIREAAE